MVILYYCICTCLPYCHSFIILSKFVAISSVLRHFFEATCMLLVVILLREKFLQFDWLRAVVFQLNLKYLHVKITNILRVVV